MLFKLDNVDWAASLFAVHIIIAENFTPLLIGLRMKIFRETFSKSFLVNNKNPIIMSEGQRQETSHFLFYMTFYEKISLPWRKICQISVFLVNLFSLLVVSTINYIVSRVVSYAFISIFFFFCLSTTLVLTKKVNRL